MFFEKEMDQLINCTFDSEQMKGQETDLKPPISLDELMEGALLDVGAFLLKSLVMTQYFYKVSFDVNTDLFKNSVLEKLTSILFE